MEDSEIITDASFVRGKELELEKERLKTSCDPERLKFNLIRNSTIVGSVLILGMVLTGRSCTLTNYEEITKRQPEITLQLAKSEEEKTKRAQEATKQTKEVTKQAEIAANLRVKLEEIATQQSAEETKKLTVILELVRSSGTDEVTIRAIDKFIKSSDRCKTPAQ